MQAWPRGGMCTWSAWVGIWRVSTHGRVCSTLGRISYGSQNSHGARHVWIEGKHHPVHRLVAFAHLPVRPTAQHVNVLHVDGNIGNNHKSNLKYATLQECGEFATRASQGRERPRAARAVLSLAPGERTWEAHSSATAAAQARGVTSAKVWACCMRGSTTQSGVEFKYAPYEHLCV
mmetsp:Transcript_42310/g.76745  ORF Transcript_42310/g.76745 Transcript_42310/m.76745 type:complete len:176 (+) Transcript_42310:30-557(+)